MIRRAAFSDLEAIYRLGERIHEQSEDRGVPIDPPTARTRVAGIMAAKNGLVLVDEVDGEITGLLVGFCEEFFWSRAKYAIALIAYAERPGAFAWMVKRFVTWALRNRGASQVILDCSFGGARGAHTAELYRRWLKKWAALVEVGPVFIARGTP